MPLFSKRQRRAVAARLNEVWETDAFTREGTRVINRLVRDFGNMFAADDRTFDFDAWVEQCTPHEEEVP